jgi:hypothetical protein
MFLTSGPPLSSQRPTAVASGPKLRSYSKVPILAEALRKAVSVQPVSVAIMAERIEKFKDLGGDPSAILDCPVTPF